MRWANLIRQPAAGWLVPLNDRVCGHERPLPIPLGQETQGKRVPGGHEVQARELLAFTPGRLHQRQLGSRAGVVTQERGVAEHERAPGRFRQCLRPVEGQRVVLVDRCGDLDRQTHRGLAERGGQLPVGLVVHEEHGGLGDLGRPPVDLS